MTWLVAYIGAGLMTVAFCWGRGFGYRRASLILMANLLVQVGLQKIVGTNAPAHTWIWLDMATALAIVFCPRAGRTHSVVAAILGAQVLMHLAFWARGNPLTEQALYLDVVGAMGWAQLVMLVGGACYGPMRRTRMAWFVGRRLSAAVARDKDGMGARQ